MLQDAHAHLQAVTDKEAMAGVLADLDGNGVGRIFCNATSPEDWDAVADLAARYSKVIPFYGIHPWFAGKCEAAWEKRIIKYLERSPSGIGEIGLDRAKEGAASLVTQKEIFKEQLDIAFRMNKPFVLHCVDAWGEVLESLKSCGACKMPFVVHSFSGSREVSEELIRMGGYLSFSLKLVEKRYKKISEAFLACPMERLLLETDFPYAPGSVSKMPAGPEDYFDCVKRVYGIAASLKGVDVRELERRVWENGTVLVH
jgi:TatD DNase family protein